MVAIPEDLRHLKDFPAFDATFQDGPKFRQNLSHWALKTDKIATAMTSLADSVQKFYDCGVEHFNAANQMLQNVQEISELVGNHSENSLAAPFQQFREELTKVWRYFEAFLGQTQMLHVGPIRELANSFMNLKKLYEELLYYRKEYLSSAEKLCACRNLIHQADRSAFNGLTEACYSAQKTYRLVLSKYLTLLRQAHTQDMVVLLKRFVEHILGLFAYYNNSAQTLKEVEPGVNDVISKAKVWRTFYEGELKLWTKLHHSVQRHIMAEFQLNVGLIVSQNDAHSTRVFRPVKKIFTSHVQKAESKTSVVPQTPTDTQPTQTEWYTTLNGDDSSNLDMQSRRYTTSDSPGEDSPSKMHLPASRTRSTPLMDPSEAEVEPPSKQLVKETADILRASSDPDILSSFSETLDGDEGEDAEPLCRNSTIHGSLRESKNDSMVRLRETSLRSPPVVRFSQDTMESAAKAIEEMLAQSQPQSQSHGSSHIGPLAKAIKKAKAKQKEKEEKKLRKTSKAYGSADDIVDDHSSEAQEMGRSSSGSPQENTSPYFPRKPSKSSIFRRKHKNKGKSSPHVLKKSPSPDSREKEKESSSKEPSLSPTAQSSSTHDLIPNDTAAPLSNGHTSYEKTSATNEPSLPQHSSSFSLPHTVSNPRLVKKKEEEDEIVNFNLQTLVNPLPEGWVKCGYLWLRMKLPNNRYAWTHIYCVVDNIRGELMIQEQSLPEPRKLENLMLCNTQKCTPELIDRNFCFRVITPSSEHLFQTLNEDQLTIWVSSLQETTEEVIKKMDHRGSKPKMKSVQVQDAAAAAAAEKGPGSESVPNAMELILNVPGNKQCADCSSTIDVEWASINLGIVLCIKCSGVHRGLGVHVSKVRSLNLDKWDRATVDFMQSQGNSKANSYYEAELAAGGLFEDTKKPSHNAKKDERTQFIQRKYVSLAFVPENTTEDKTSATTQF